MEKDYVIAANIYLVLSLIHINHISEVHVEVI